MTLRLHRHHHAERLLELLAQRLAEAGDEAFTPDRVIVPSAGLRPWVLQSLAQANGVAAQVEVQTWDALMDALGTTPDADEDPWSADRLPWAVLQELDALAPEPDFDALRAYLAPQHGSRRRVLLARQIAEVLRRSLALRGEVEGDWLKPLFEALVQRTGRDPREEARDGIENLREQGPPAGFARRIAVLYLDGLAPRLPLLEALAQHVEVELFHLAPSKEPRHPLLESFGRVTREAEQALCEAFPELGAEGPEGDEPEPATLLQHLQADLRFGPPESPRQLAQLDRSILFHDCDGPTRELEVLRDELLRMMESSELQPRDVLVLCADTSSLAPPIAQVFGAGSPRRVRPEGGWGEHGFPRLPFEIAERTEFGDNEAATALLRALELGGLRFHASGLVDLLGLEAVRRRVGLDESQLGAIASWLEEAAIRWGRDADHRGQESRPALPDFTWRQGLDRLLLGLALQYDEQAALWQGLLPAADVEGAGAHEVRALVALAEALLEIFERLEGASQARDAAFWQDELPRILDALVRCSGEKRWQEVRVRVEIERALKWMKSHDLRLDREGMREALAAHFGGLQGGGRFGAGKVTFADLSSHRVVPHPVIALVGLDIDSFPRRPQTPEFDLVAADPRPGEPIPHEQDRHALLLALLGAREHLIVTWSGHSDRDGSEQPPSVLVSELLDTLARDYRALDADTEEAMREALVVQHPLDPYGAEAFEPPAGSRAVTSPDRRAHAAATAVRRRSDSWRFWSGPLPEVPLDGLSIGALYKLLCCPTRELFRTRLGTKIEDRVETLADQDPLKLGPLDSWKLRDALIAEHLAGRSADPQLARAAGLLPLGVAGDRVFEGEAQKAELVAEAGLQRLQGASPEPVLVQGDVNGVALQGRVEGCFEAGRLMVTASKIDGKRLLKAWVDHLALNALAPERAGPTWLVGQGTRKSQPVRVLRLDPPEPDEATRLLADLVALYRQGQRWPLPFAPKAALDYLRELHRERDDEDPTDPAEAAEGKALKAWGDADNGDFDAGRDPHVQRVFGDLAPIGVSEPLPGLPPELHFEPLAERVMGPILQHSTEEEA